MCAFLRHKKPHLNRVDCPGSVLFDIIQSDLDQKLCSDIRFLWENRNHDIGVWGENGNTYRNLHFYFDDMEFGTFQELKECANLEGRFLSECDVTVTECDGCYLETIPQLMPFCEYSG